MAQEAKTNHPEEQGQRIQCSLAQTASGKRVQIEVESFDSVLGWYTSGQMVLPLHQLPLLQQAIDEMQRLPHEECGKIIPFPSEEAVA